MRRGRPRREPLLAGLVRRHVPWRARRVDAEVRVRRFVAGPRRAVAANAFKRDGYTFAGWNTAKDRSGTAYADKASVKLEGDMTLYAQWTKGSAAKSSPKTGDASSTLIVVLSATAIAALCLLAWSTRKRNARTYNGMHARR